MKSYYMVFCYWSHHRFYKCFLQYKGIALLTGHPTFIMEQNTCNIQEGSVKNTLYYDTYVDNCRYHDSYCNYIWYCESYRHTYFNLYGDTERYWNSYGNNKMNLNMYGNILNNKGIYIYRYQQFRALRAVPCSSCNGLRLKDLEAQGQKHDRQGSPLIPAILQCPEQHKQEQWCIINRKNILVRLLS